MIEIIGWLGAFFFSVCAVPQAYKSYKDKHSDGVSWGFINLWAAGEVCMFLYIILTTAQLPLIMNYVFNGVCLAVIFYYKLSTINKGR
jgi:uncharacterized protein with PQ loop repeat